MKPKQRKLISKYNGRKGGRPLQDSKIRIELPGIELVILTPDQYGHLVNKYGIQLLSKALTLLDNQLKKSGRFSDRYAGKNNYAHFRSDGWLLNEARNM